MSKNPRLGVWFAAAAMIFFTRALLFSTWQSRSPEVQTALNLNTAEMGLLVMLFPAGGLLGIFFANSLMNRFGAGKLTIVGFSLGAISLYGLGLAVSAGNVWVSAICLIGMGLPMAIADFTGNIQGTEGPIRVFGKQVPVLQIFAVHTALPHHGLCHCGGQARFTLGKTGARKWRINLVGFAAAVADGFRFMQEITAKTMAGCTLAFTDILHPAFQAWRPGGVVAGKIDSARPGFLNHTGYYCVGPAAPQKKFQVF